MKRTTAAVLVALMFVVALVGTVSAQDGCLVIGPVPGGIILWCPDTIPPVETPTPTATATETPITQQPTATATAIPATPTPMPMPTATSPTSPLPTPTGPVSPLPTPLPTATMIMPMPTATATLAPVANWKCPDSLHNKNVWHPHYNQAGKCWYDHIHGTDPASIAYRFGAPWSFLANYPGFDATKADWQLGTISYPWLTGNGMEQSMKHGGYKWQAGDIAPQAAGVVKIPPNCGGWDWVTGNGPWSCVVAFRYEEHFGNAFAGMDGMPPMFDSATRLHSFWVEMQDADGGIIGGGGHWDTGRFWKYSTYIIPMPSDPNPVSPSQTGQNGKFTDPYRGDSYLCGEAPAKWGTPALWTSRPPWVDKNFSSYDYKHNNHLGVFSVHKDISFCTSYDGSQHKICPDGQVCPWANNSDYGPFKVWAYLSPSYDGGALDKDPRPGYVTMYTFTNVQGLPAPTCKAPGADCVPFYAVRARVGWHDWFSGKGQPYVDSIDFDQSPSGTSYINDWGN